MATIPDDVAEAFVNGEQKRRGECLSTGDAFYSYGLKVATRESDDDALIGKITVHVDLENRRGQSATTNRHLLALRQVLKHRPGLTVEYA